MLKELEEVEAANKTDDNLSTEVQNTDKKKKKKKTKKQSSKDVTTKTLRDDEGIRRKVDQLMGSTVGNKFADNDTEDSSSSTGEESSSATSSSSRSHSQVSRSESSDERTSHRRKKLKKKNSGKEESPRASKKKHKSGKDRKSSSKVFYPQEWPHNILGQHLATKQKQYEQLTMAEFCAGYISIMEDISDRRELKYRLQHFKDSCI